MISLILFGCHNNTKPTIVKGHIYGKLIDSLEYTFLTNEGQYLLFRNSVPIDSTGYFNIETQVPNGISFFTILASGSQGTLVIESGQTYDVSFDFREATDFFKVQGTNEKGQNLYNKLPSPFYINLSKLINEFNSDTTSNEITQDITSRKSGEMKEFKDLADKKEISSSFYNFIKADRECYYASLTASIAKNRLFNIMRVTPINLNAFPKELKDMWSGVFAEYPPMSEKYVKTRWWLEYAENYILFNEYMKDDFSADSLMKIYKAKQIHTHNLNEARKHLSGDLLKFYSAYYLAINAFQGKNEKELIFLYEKFKKDFPNNFYSQFIAPLIDPVRVFYEKIETEKKHNITFIDNYSQLNTLKECLKFFKGTPVFIDVWATWCAPCLNEFRNKDRLNDVLVKNGYSSLYISTDKNENDSNWKELIVKYNITSGYHIRANKYLYNDLIKIYGDNNSITIPWYMIINKKGEIALKHASKPSELEKLEQELKNK